MSDDNIILFPENKIVRKGTPEQAKVSAKVKERQTREFVEQNIDLMARQVLQQFVDMGIKTTAPLFTKDLALVIDCLRGLVYRDFGVKHYNVICGKLIFFSKIS